MTKAQEIKLLDQMIKKFGIDSYIGEWLKDCKPTIIWAIENDYPIAIPMVTDRR